MSQIKSRINDVPKDSSAGNTHDRLGEIGNYWKETIEVASTRIEKLIETVRDPYLTDRDFRIDHTPNGLDAYFEGVRGESKCLPKNDTERGLAAFEKLRAYGLDGIIYRDGFPDFKPCAEAIVEIDNMTSYRAGNFSQACEKLAERWNEENRDGKSDWTAREVRDWQKANGLTIHECEDRKTCVFVDKDIHCAFLHCGGVTESIQFEALSERKPFYALFDN